MRLICYPPGSTHLKVGIQQPSVWRDELVEFFKEQSHFISHYHLLVTCTPLSPLMSGDNRYTPLISWLCAMATVQRKQRHVLANNIGSCCVRAAFCSQLIGRCRPKGIHHCRQIPALIFEKNMWLVILRYITVRCTLHASQLSLDHTVAHDN